MSIDLEVPVQTDPASILKLGTDYLQTIYPNWTPNESSYDFRELAAHAAMASEFLQTALQVPEGAITRFVGEVLFQTPPNPAIAATGLTKWTLVDALEHTIPAGTELTIKAADGSLVAYQVGEDIVKPPGGTTVSDVPIVAVEPGAIASKLSGELTLVDSLVEAGASWVRTVIVEGETTGGADAETDAAYTARVTALAPLLKLAIVRAPDFAAAAPLLVPQIARALAIDEYEPETSEFGVEKFTTVAPIDANGRPSITEVKDKLQAEYERLRERTFRAVVIDPTYTSIAAHVEGIAVASSDPTVVKGRVETAVEELLSPAVSGIPADGDTSVWEDRPVLRYQDAVTAVNNVLGFDHYTVLTLNGGTADIVLAGPAALPEVGAITAVVDAP
jgi:Baseplate J-like protein